MDKTNIKRIKVHILETGCFPIGVPKANVETYAITRTLIKVVGGEIVRAIFQTKLCASKGAHNCMDARKAMQ